MGWTFLADNVLAPSFCIRAGLISVSASQTSGSTFGRDLTTANGNEKRSLSCVGQKPSAR